MAVLIAVNVALTVIFVVLSLRGARRWLRWTFLCRRGRRCADVVLASLPLPAEAPAGLVARFTYECERCGTTYAQTYLIGDDGAFTPSGRQRVSA